MREWIVHTQSVCVCLCVKDRSKSVFLGHKGVMLESIRVLFYRCAQLTSFSLFPRQFCRRQFCTMLLTWCSKLSPRSKGLLIMLFGVIGVTPDAVFVR
jgi:hypothetical protein